MSLTTRNELNVLVLGSGGRGEFQSNGSCKPLQDFCSRGECLVASTRRRMLVGEFARHAAITAGHCHPAGVPDTLLMLGASVNALVPSPMCSPFDSSPRLQSTPSAGSLPSRPCWGSSTACLATLA